MSFSLWLFRLISVKVFSSKHCLALAVKMQCWGGSVPSPAEVPLPSWMCQTLICWSSVGRWILECQPYFKGREQRWSNHYFRCNSYQKGLCRFWWSDQVTSLWFLNVAVSSLQGYKTSVLFKVIPSFKFKNCPKFAKKPMFCEKY